MDIPRHLPKLTTKTVEAFNLDPEIYKTIYFLFEKIFRREFIKNLNLPEAYETLEGKDDGKLISDIILFYILQKINENSVPIMTDNEKIYFENLKKLQDPEQSFEVLKMQANIQKNQSIMEEVEFALKNFMDTTRLITGSIVDTKIKETMEKMVNAFKKLQSSVIPLIANFQMRIYEMKREKEQKQKMEQKEIKQKNKQLEDKIPFFHLISEGAFQQEFLDEVEMLFTSFSKGQYEVEGVMIKPLKASSLFFSRSAIACNLIKSKYKDAVTELRKVNFKN